MTTQRTPLKPAAPRRRPPSSLGATVARTTAANVAVPLSALLTGPLLARYLGPADRGTLAAVVVPLTLVTLLGAVGLPEAVTYAVAARLAPLRQVLRAGLAIGFASGVASAAVIWPLAPVLLRNSPEYVGLMRWMTVLVVVSMAMAAVRAAAQGRGRFDLSNAERWLSVLTRVPLLLVLAVAGALTVTSAALATYATGVVAMMVLWYVLRERDEPPVPQAPRLERRLLTFGAQAWIGTVASILVLRLDQAVLAPLVGAAQLGFYAVAVSLAEVPSTLQLAMRDVMFPTATDRGDPHLIARSNRILMLLSGGLAVAGAIACPLVLPLLFGDDFEPAVRMAQILFLACIPAGIGMIVGAGLLSVGRPRARSVAQVAGLAVNVGLLLALVGPLGAIGAAWAAVASATFIAAVSVAQFTRATAVTPRECLVPLRADAATVAALVRRFVARLRSMFKRPRAGEEG
jgi:O-antigen/teichoic acid export membrane protein